MFDPKMHEERTIAIIGGGPAGSATALSLVNSLTGCEASQTDRCQVHIFNTEHPTTHRFGESIPPAATPVLKRLGVQQIVEEGDDHLVCPGSVSVWNSDTPGHNDFFWDIVGYGYHLDRARFDEQMLTAAKRSACVTVHQGWRLTSATKQSVGMELGFSVSGRANKTIKADFVVDATGKAANFARRLDVARNTFDEVIFLCCMFDMPEGASMLSHSFVEAVPEGWWYAACLPNNKVVMTFCTDVEGMKANCWDEPDQWLGLLRQTKWLHKKIPNALLHTPPSSHQITIQVASSTILSAVCGNGWLAVGDAASSYDPITSAGITKAMMQGELAGQAISAALFEGKPEALQGYQTRVFDDFNQYVSLRNQLYSSETRFTKSRFWLKRLGHA
ncbi:MAG: tryptophan 7-halogenase [Magnetovibrio sp.]|nr:tryptophan 7-halogenase [Magnetovibrio sp.]